MNTTVSTSPTRAFRTRTRSIGAALALAGAAAAAAYGITATAVDLTPPDDQHQASTFLLGDGSVRFVSNSIGAISL